MANFDHRKNAATLPVSNPLLFLTSLHQVPFPHLCLLAAVFFFQGNLQSSRYLHRFHRIKYRGIVGISFSQAPSYELDTLSPETSSVGHTS